MARRKKVQKTLFCVLYFESLCNLSLKSHQTQRKPNEFGKKPNRFGKFTHLLLYEHVMLRTS